MRVKQPFVRSGNEKIVAHFNFLSLNFYFLTLGALTSIFRVGNLVIWSHYFGLVSWSYIFFLLDKVGHVSLLFTNYVLFCLVLMRTPDEALNL